MGGDRRVGTGDLGVSATGRNYITKNIFLLYHALHGVLILVGEVLEGGKIVQMWLQ